MKLSRRAAPPVARPPGRRAAQGQCRRGSAFELTRGRHGRRSAERGRPTQTAAPLRPRPLRCRACARFSPAKVRPTLPWRCSVAVKFGVGGRPRRRIGGPGAHSHATTAQVSQKVQSCLKVPGSVYWMPRAVRCARASDQVVDHWHVAAQACQACVVTLVPPCAGKELPKGFVARVRTRKAGMSQVRGAMRACLRVAPQSQRGALCLLVLCVRVCAGCWLTVDLCWAAGNRW